MSTDEIIDAENEAEEITGQEEVGNDAPAGHSAYKVAPHIVTRKQFPSHDSPIKSDSSAPGLSQRMK